MDYFSDYWNMNDLTYLLLNMTVLISNCTGIGVELETQRVLGTISIVFLWFKVFDWLRLFDSTAFFVLLI